MKQLFPFICLLMALHGSSQTPGQWTWVSGSNQLNYMGNFGTQGVPSPTNAPPGLYEACEWTDKNGNFWFYGGTTSANGFFGDLWKFDVNSKQWTWIQGPGISGSMPSYGVKGVASSANNPGFRTTSYTWVDTLGDFWLYGGIGNYGNGAGTSYSDLWKYNITSNMWTWMKGDSGINGKGVYANKGVEDSIARPGALDEMGVSWTSNTGDLWLLDQKGCLWKYRLQTNNWTWMKGDSASGYPKPVYGIKGIPAAANTPGFTYFDYTRWKDSKGDLWYLYSSASSYLRVLWKYELSTNNWTWVWGDTVASNYYHYGSKCLFNDTATHPLPRLETRSCWIDSLDNLWLMGGASAFTSSNFVLSDLIYYDTRHGAWVWADDPFTQVPNPTYGTQGVPGANNLPASRQGAIPFKNDNTHLWLFGGMNYNFNGAFGDLWMYTIDAACLSTDAVNEQSAGSSCVIFPNPSCGSLTVSGTAMLKRILVFDILGNKLQEYCPGDVQQRLFIKQAGVYYVLISGENGTAIKKVIIEN